MSYDRIGPARGVALSALFGLLFWLLLAFLLGCGANSPVSMATAQNPPSTQTGWQWRTVPNQPKRVMLWGGTAGSPHALPANTATTLDPYLLHDGQNFPQGVICWDTFQVGSKGRGPVASYLVVQPETGTGIAIRDDAPFQRPRLCAPGVPRVTLINNWTDQQVMTFFLEGEVLL